MAAPWEASNLTHSHKRDAHRCAHQCRRRFPGPCSKAGSPNSGTNHCEFAPMLFRSLRRCRSLFSASWRTAVAYALVSLGTPGPRAGLGCSDDYRAAVRRKLRACHVHVQLGCIAQGLLQHLAINHTAQVWSCFRSWLRTMNPAMPPSELIVANALRCTLPVFIAVPALESDLTKIMAKYHRHDPPPDGERMAA